MADSPGKVLSSFASSNERKGSISKLGGCAGVFSQLLDRFNGRKLFPHKLLPSVVDRPKHNTISHTEEKLPMAKLLLIADENRIRSSKRDGDYFLDEACQENKNCEAKRSKKSVGVVARLMGLETMPSPEPLIREKKQFEVFRNTKEAQSPRKLLQISPILAEEGRKSTKAIDTRIQTLKRTKPPHIDQLHKFEAKISSLNSVADALKQSSTKTSSNIKVLSCETITQVKSIEAEDLKALFLSRLPAMPSFQVDSPLRSILSPSRTSSKLLSPIKSPLSSSKSRARLFGAAARVLEPSLCPARHLGFQPHDTKCPLQASVGEDMNEQKMTTSGASSAPQLVRPAAERRNSAAKHQSNSVSSSSSSSPSMSTDCKGQVKSRNVNITSETRAQSSSKELNAVKPLISKQEQAKNSSLVKQEKKPISKLAREQKLATPLPQRQEASTSSNGGSRLIPWRKSNKASIKGSQLDSKQDNAALPVHVKEENANQDEASNRSSRPIISRRQPRSTKGSSSSTVSYPLRTDKSLQDFKKLLKAPLESVNQEGSGIGVKTGSPNVGKAMSSSKTTSTGAQSKSVNSAQVKVGSSSIRPSAKRKASNHIAKPRIRVEVLTAVGAGFAYDAQCEGIMQSFDGISPSICKEQSSIYYQSDLDTPMECSLDGNNATNTSEVGAVVHTRVRARWDVGDETKRNITKNCISSWKSDRPLADCHSGSNSFRGEDALQTTEAAAGILEELLHSLNASPSQLCEDESNALFNERKRSCGDFMSFPDDSSSVLDCFLQGAEQRPQSYDNFPPKEDTSIRDCESMSDSLCAEEFEQPSPISILESPFQDSASSSSDSFEASHGGSQWEVNANEITEITDCMSIMGKQIEDVKIHEAQTTADGMDVTSCIHCIHPGVFDAIIDIVMENEDAYAKKSLEAELFSAENAIWERLALSGALFDPAIFDQLEKHTQHFTWRASMPSNLCIENDSEVSSCRMRMCMHFMSGCRESALQKRKLLFDCIEEALRLSLELASQSHGFRGPCMPLPVAHLLKAVYKQIDEWKGLATSMNLDDMMKKEINTGMGRWFKFGDEVEKLAENIEDMIIRSLMDELMEVVSETTA